MHQPRIFRNRRRRGVDSDDRPSAPTGAGDALGSGLIVLTDVQDADFTTSNRFCQRSRQPYRNVHFDDAQK
jgi:hypothetical protein